MSSDSSDGTSLTKEEIEEIIEQARQEFERNFTTSADPQALRDQLEQSLNSKIPNTCQNACMVSYADCRSAGGSQTDCQTTLNTCMAVC